MGELRTDAKSRAFLIFSKGMFLSRHRMAVLNRISFSSLEVSGITVVDSSALSKRQVVVGCVNDDDDVMMRESADDDVNAVAVGVVFQPATSTTTNHKVTVGVGVKQNAAKVMLLFTQRCCLFFLRLS